jgi:hypothetical protein
LTTPGRTFDGNPHIWFRLLKGMLSGGRRSFAHPNGYDFPGSFYLKVHDGWIHRPEGSFPELIGLFMKVFHLEGL